MSEWKGSYWMEKVRAYTLAKQAYSRLGEEGLRLLDNDTVYWAWLYFDRPHDPCQWMIDREYRRRGGSLLQGRGERS